MTHNAQPATAVQLIVGRMFEFAVDFQNIHFPFPPGNRIADDGLLGTVLYLKYLF
jgi:hypothetical protein